MPDLIFTCLLTGLLSVIVALLLVSFAHNRVEGMALAKLSGLLMLGLPVPFFVRSGVQYLFFSLPSFWIAKYRMEGVLWLALPAAATSLLWIWALTDRFQKELS